MYNDLRLKQSEVISDGNECKQVFHLREERFSSLAVKLQLQVPFDCIMPKNTNQI